MGNFTYNEKLNDVINKSKSLAINQGHGSWGGAHIMTVVLNPIYGINDILKSLGKDTDYIFDWADMRLELVEKSMSSGSSPTESAEWNTVVEEADIVRSKLGFDEIDPLCVFIALIKPGIAFSSEQLNTLPVRDYELLEMYNAAPVNRINQSTAGTREGFVPPPTTSNAAEFAIYCQAVSLESNSSSDSKIRILGRENEVRLLAEGLLKFNQNHLLLTGESGVGKSAVIEAFIDFIQSSASPKILKNKSYFRLNITILLSGAKYGGEIEERLGKIFKYLNHTDNAVLILDDLHLLLGGKNGNNNILSFLHAGLADASFTVIGSIQIDEYKKQLESKAGIARLFDLITINELDSEVCKKCVASHRESMEKHHGVKINQSAIEEGIKLSKRYLKEQKIPDAAIRLIDQTMAAVVLLNQNSQNTLLEIKKYYDNALSINDNTQKAEELKWVAQQIQGKFSPVLLGQLVSANHDADLWSEDAIQTTVLNTITELEGLAQHKYDTITDDEIAAVIAHKTGIPIGKLKTQEQTKLLDIENNLKQRVIGQDHAVTSLSDAIIESRQELKKVNQPIGSFFFLGPTGTGKTELAKALASFLFNDEQAMIRFDMSEFKEEHSAALLYGAPPGYVGYEEGGLLVNKIRQKPYSVVLFDEIEKAHPSVYDIFLQIMDEGHIHDRLGRQGSFSNAIVLFTSNIGSEWISEQFAKGIIPEHKDLTDIMAGNFRPEFLGRLTEVIPFSPISEASVIRIFDIQLKLLADQLKAKHIKLEISENARKIIAMSGYSPRYGARPIASVIRTQIRRPISKMLMRGEVSSHQTIGLDCDEKEELIWTVK